VPNGSQTKRYEVTKPDGTVMQIEKVIRKDWNDMTEACPVCGGTEFNHIQFEGGLYQQRGETIIQQKDYWNKKGTLYTECKNCDEVLFKHPAYDLLHTDI